MKMSLEPELKVQMELEAHEKECAIRYQAVGDKLEGLRQTHVAFRGYDYGVNGYSRWPCCIPFNEDVRRLV